ncbi:hypothetical protein Arub01_09660 [Actinomadura rubrobrunea]|uniref:Uncharacterized protein n=1 Tax=Actinomadura rubrobrunea TaxID=115335 RepID=A0A9W6PSL1_9ACTN|nr:hypothetical protein [Actinomadura rubrobrunea]GLW62722.1 hypothetical protein Arub01_09660 [Actinomadura rubrobrunea]
MTAIDHDSRLARSLEELRDAYRARIDQLTAERDEARRQAYRAKEEADVARANLAILTARVQELLAAAARHLPDLQVDAPDDPPVLEGRIVEDPRALPGGPKTLPAPAADGARLDGPR